MPTAILRFARAAAFPMGAHAHRFEFEVLDDLRNPILLRWSGNGSSSQVIRIEYPEPGRIERALAANETVDVYGIYLAPNSSKQSIDGVGGVSTKSWELHTLRPKVMSTNRQQPRISITHFGNQDL